MIGMSATSGDDFLDGPVVYWNVVAASVVSHFSWIAAKVAAAIISSSNVSSTNFKQSNATVVRRCARIQVTANNE
jgi:hypothetical protein